MTRVKNKIAASLGLLALVAASGAYAGQPEPWQLGMQAGATPIMEGIRWFEQYTLWFIVPITLLVTVLLAWVAVRYRASKNPGPSRTSNNAVIEIIWTLGPVVILLLLAVPSFQLLPRQHTPDEEPALTVKATGMHWYWDYEYQDDSGNPF